eukprot:584182-Hanusia_phi.AAC.2
MYRLERMYLGGDCNSQARSLGSGRFGEVYGDDEMDDGFDADIDVNALIASDPDVLDLVDNETGGQLWEGFKDYVAANPDALDALQLDDSVYELFQRFWKWMKGKKKGGAGQDHATDDADGAADNEDAGSKEGDADDEAMNGNMSTKMAIACRPNLLDHLDHFTQGGVWDSLKSYIASDPEFIEEMGYDLRGIKNLYKRGANKLANLRDPTGEKRKKQALKKQEKLVSKHTKKLNRHDNIKDATHALSQEEIKRLAHERHKAMKESKEVDWANDQARKHGIVHSRFGMRNSLVSSSADIMEKELCSEVQQFKIPFECDNGVLSSSLLQRYRKKH